MLTATGQDYLHEVDVEKRIEKDRTEILKGFPLFPAKSRSEPRQGRYYLRNLQHPNLLCQNCAICPDPDGDARV